MYLSVIIPTYNEEKRITRTLAEIDKYLRGQNYDSEIIVVDGGSKDRTREVVRERQSEIKNLKLLEIIALGKGHAVKEGMLAAQGDFRLFTDADNSTSINQVENLLKEFEQGYDIVIGSRDVKGAVLDPPQPAFRRFVGWVFKVYRKIVLGLWDIQDTQCGFKGFSAKAASDIFPRAKITAFAFDPEILLIGRKFGYKIKEVPVHWKNDLESTVNFKSMIKMALDLLKIRWNIISHKYG
ncbi:MAG: glycosyl transferase family protein [Parcubacteria group bacterium Gr01-1014_30]|nr:MAG: glycosyl transferase family protein [Parcubacteria group bacterium Gr01-1014_30]